MDLKISCQMEVDGLLLDSYNNSENELILYAYVSSHIEYEISNYRFLSDDIGAGYFGLEFYINNHKVKYEFEKGHCQIYVDDNRVENTKERFDDNHIIHNVSLINKIIKVTITTED